MYSKIFGSATPHTSSMTTGCKHSLIAIAIINNNNNIFFFNKLVKESKLKKINKIINLYSGKSRAIKRIPKKKKNQK